MPPTDPPAGPPGVAARRRPGRWWRRRSLRTRLTAATGLVIVAGMITAGGLLIWRVHASLLATLDTTVSQQALTTADQAAQAQLPTQLPDPDNGAPSIQVVGASGRVRSATADLEGQPRMFRIRGGAGDPRLATVTTAQGSDPGDGPVTYRLAAVATRTPTGPVTVYAAAPTGSVTAGTGELIRTLAAGLPILAAVLILLGWLVVGRALRPVDALRRQAADIPGTDLTRRLTPPEARDELARLAGTFNQLLARIQESGARQRQFVADAAHELRSPIATLRAQLEVAERSTDPAAAGRAIPGLIGDTDRLSALVDDLLALARLDAHPVVRRQPVDLDDIVLAQAHRLRTRGPRVDATGVSAGRVLGDPAALSRIARNLIDNATRHAAGTVRVALATTGSQVVLTVADDGPGIAPADRGRVFDRFVRLDDARSRDAGGAGLGLAIVADATRVHGGTVTVGDNHPGAVFTVTLPAAEVGGAG